LQENTMQTKFFRLSSVTMTLVALSMAAAHPAKAQTFHNGSRITLECLGDIPGAKFLDGRTQDGTVGLAPETGGPFTGTAWRAHRVGGRFWRLETLGAIPGPAVWLDGRTETASVGLAPHAHPPFTGATWEITELGQAPTGEGIYALRALGDQPGPQFLDCHTADGTVGLAPNPQDPSFSGTRWVIRTQF
jgi:hypothetical protein